MSTSTRMDWPKGVAVAALVACSTSACSGSAGTSSSAEPASAPKTSAEQVRAALNPFPNSAGSIKEKTATPLGELAWIDSNEDGRPDTLALHDQVIVPARKATNGALYGLREVSSDGDKDPKTGRYVKKRILIEQSAIDCQQVLVDLTGPQVWVSSRFPDENKFPGWVKPDVASGCFEVTWVTWKAPFPYFYFMGPESNTIFAYNAQRKSVVGPIDPDDAPPHPRKYSLVPRPMHLIDAEKKQR